MYEPKGRHDPRLGFMWPAFAAASASEFAALLAKHFIGLASDADDRSAPREPAWATPNTIALELKTMRLRDFSTAADGVPTLLCAPFALHSAAVADLAPGHSLVAALRDAGLRRLFVTDWRSATPEMRYLRIDDYLAELNVAVDRLGGSVDLVGLCQGGWMSLLYAARFPAKVRKLVLAGAPIDIAAGQSALSALADASPLALFHELVKLGDGLVLGREVQKFWGAETLDRREIHDLLQTPEPIGSPAFAALEATFRAWHVATVDLPGAYYLEVIEKLYKRNEIARRRVRRLGRADRPRQAACPDFPAGGARRRAGRARRNCSRRKTWSARRRAPSRRRWRRATTADCSWGGRSLPTTGRASRAGWSSPMRRISRRRRER